MVELDSGQAACEAWGVVFVNFLVDFSRFSSFQLAQVCPCLGMQVDFPLARNASAAPSTVLCRQMLEFLPAAPTTGEIKL